ncbi:hypothetical protein PTKIN_Ptkin05aG0214000 [Pterospermum kingtungense]
MEIRLFEAAQIGDIESLHQLLRENAVLLDQIALFSSENPLHIAHSAGQFEFVKEIINLKPDFAKEVNQDGFSPMHMAAVSGHLEIVRELMKVDPSLCRQQQAIHDKKTPFHLAAIKGRANEINEMVSGCAECIEDVTLQNETALHLAVKHGQFEAVSVLVHWIRELKKEDVFNMKDEQGNTVLHIATWRKQRKVIDLLLDSNTITSGLLNVNAANQSNLSALDMLLVLPSEAGDREIVDILHRAGALRARDISLSSVAPLDSGRPSEVNQLQQKELVEYFKFKNGRDSPSEAWDTLLIITTLVASATFQVAFNPPFGLWQDNYFPDQNNGSSNNNTSKKHLAGSSILGTFSGVSFSFFALFNSIGFFVPLYMVKILTSKFPLEFQLAMCMLAMYFSYNNAIISISPEDVRLVVIIIIVILSSFTPVLCKWTLRFLDLVICFSLGKFHRITTAFKRGLPELVS